MKEHNQIVIYPSFNDEWMNKKQKTLKYSNLTDHLALQRLKNHLLFPDEILINPKSYRRTHSRNSRLNNRI